jgi:hypothetical protein
MRLSLLSLLCAGTIHSKSMILNYNLKTCRNCIHFQPSSSSDDFDSSSAKCKYFGKKDIVTDKITYDFADSCRMDETKCGMHAKYFEEEPNVDFKIMKHQLLKNLPFTLLISLVILEIIGLNYKSTLN